MHCPSVTYQTSCFQECTGRHGCPCKGGKANPRLGPSPSLVRPAAAAEAHTLGGQRLLLRLLTHLHALIWRGRTGGGGLLAPVAQPAGRSRCAGHSHRRHARRPAAAALRGAAARAAGALTGRGRRVVAQLRAVQLGQLGGRGGSSGGLPGLRIRQQHAFQQLPHLRHCAHAVQLGHQRGVRGVASCRQVERPLRGLWKGRCASGGTLMQERDKGGGMQQAACNMRSPLDVISCMPRHV